MRRFNFVAFYVYVFVWKHTFAIITTICLPDGYPNATVHIVLCHGCDSKFGVVYSVYLVSSEHKKWQSAKIKQKKHTENEFNEEEEEEEKRHLTSIIDSIVGAHKSAKHANQFSWIERQNYKYESIEVAHVWFDCKWYHCSRNMCERLRHLYLAKWNWVPFPISNLNYFVNFR